MKLQVKRLTETAILPTKAHATDSGFDLYADEDVLIEPGGTIVISTGISVKLPTGYEAQVRPRSGVTSKTNLRVQLGTIDNAYRGDIGVIVDNIHKESGYIRRDGDKSFVKTVSGGIEKTYGNHAENSTLIKKGDKIAQLVLVKIPMFNEVEEVDELDSTDRGDKGFGSSGY